MNWVIFVGAWILTWLASPSLSSDDEWRYTSPRVRTAILVGLCTGVGACFGYGLR